MKSFIIVSCLLHAALAAPQFITFKDGQVGVNFFGYHAEAGLGGGQNRNGLLGGLHASAGTPYGQNAAAGLGGNVNGRASGLLYAGAQATPDIGASTILGGDTSSGGYGGAESHIPGKRTGHSRTVLFEKSQPSGDVSDESQYVTEGITAVQKIKSPKKFRNNDSTVTKRRQFIATTDLYEDEQPQYVNSAHRSDVVASALQIPVGILQSLQQSLGR